MQFFQRKPTEYKTAVLQKPNIGLLSRQIAQAFNRDEVRELCFDLSINFDELPEKGLSIQCAHLIEILQRAGRLPELLTLLRAKRPRYDWQTPTIPTPQDLRNREKLLQNVHTIWIEGFLYQSLPHAIALALKLSYKPQAVARRSLHVPGQLEDPPVDTPLIDVFEKYGRSLLILGDPGSGKTITLLQLAESLIATAQQDPSQPIPVILNLSSWAQQKQPLLDWLVEELFMQYGMSRKLSRSWIEQNQLLYLLDGLDEVAAEARDACVQAINNFKADYPAELIVCSRLADYEQLEEKLNVGTAVRLHPLTDEQIHAYLSQPDLELTAVRDALATDPNLNELAHSPLFLNIMTLAYRGFTREQLQSFGTLANRRKHLFDTYVEEMFKRRPLPKKIKFSFNAKNLLKQKSESYSQSRVIHQLSNIAYGMKQHNLSTFYTEQIQPTWLSKKGRATYRWFVGFSLGCLASIFAAPGLMPVISLIGGFSFTLLGSFKSTKLNAVTSSTTCYLLLLLMSFYSHRFNLLTFSNVFLGLVVEDKNYYPGTLNFLLSNTGLILSLFIGISALKPKISMRERWNFKIPHPKIIGTNFVRWFLIGAFFAIWTSINFGIFYTWINPNEFSPIPWLFAGVTLGLFLSPGNIYFFAAVFGLTGIFLSALESKEIQTKKHLGEGIQASFFSGLVASVIGIILILGFGQFEHLIDMGVTMFFSLLLFIPHFFFLWFGGLAFIQHVSLRIALQRKIPFDQTHLESLLLLTSERLITYQAGSGFGFIHRTLLEYFAALHPDAQPPAGSVQHDPPDTNLREV